jgi:hypothetical protein
VHKNHHRSAGFEKLTLMWFTAASQVLPSYRWAVLWICLYLAAWPGKPDAYWASFYKSVAALREKDADLALKIGL